MGRERNFHHSIKKGYKKENKGKQKIATETKTKPLPLTLIAKQGSAL
jgi:hypothetical protein